MSANQPASKSYLVPGGRKKSVIEHTAASKTVIKNAWSFTFTLLRASMPLCSGKGKDLPSFYVLADR
jgi:hypothetical protein